MTASSTAKKHEFLPHRRRYFWRFYAATLYQILPAVLIYLFFLGRFLWPPIWGTLLIAAAIAAYSTYFNLPKYTIAIDVQTIAGYSTVWRRPTSFSLRKIDPSESARTGLWQAVKGYTYIVSTEGDRILLSYFGFTPDEVRHILTLCSLTREESKPA